MNFFIVLGIVAILVLAVLVVPTLSGGKQRSEHEEKLYRDYMRSVEERKNRR